MKIQIDHQQGLISDSEQLAGIAVKMLRIRSKFLDHLENLTATFSEPIKRHYLDRLVRAEDRHMLGEYAPFLLADLLEIPDDIAERVAIPWLVLYEHSLLIDDIVDVKGSSWKQEVLVSQVLFDDFVSLWHERFLRYPDLWQAFLAYHRQGVAAALSELKRGLDATTANAANAESDHDNHVTMGRKSALVKFCGAALSAEHKGRVLKASEEDGIDSLCAGIQLLDDLADSVEDYKEGRYTFPLRTAFEGIGRLQYLSHNIHFVLSEDEIVSILILSGAVPLVCKLVCHYLTSGLTALQVRIDSATGLYLQSLVEHSLRAAVAIDVLFEENRSEIETILLSFREGTEKWWRVPATSINGDTWAEVKRCFKMMPSASN